MHTSVDAGSATVTAHRRLRVMNCDATVAINGDHRDRRRLEALANHAVDRLHQLEARWSRFRSESEISRVNRAGGTPRLVSDDTVELVTAMVQGWRLTEGDYDPTLLGALVNLGYAGSRDGRDDRTRLADDVAPVGRPDGVLVDPATGVVVVPRGTALDPGGVGKGLAADLLTDELLASGARGALVEIGGDLRAAGDAGMGRAWTVGVADPLDRDGHVVLTLGGGAVATSSTRRRTWQHDDGLRHHLVDPTTRRPTPDRSPGEVVGCTVVAGRGAVAEVMTKIAFVAGTHAALRRYESFGLAARITTADGEHLHTDTWKEFVG